MISIGSLVPYRIIPAITGGEKGVYLYLKNLALFAEPVCFTVSENNTLSEQFPTLPVLGTASNKLRYVNPLLFFKLRKLIKKHRLQSLVLEHPYYGWLAFLLKKFTGIKIVIHSHNIEALRFKDLKKSWWKVLAWYEKKTHQLADGNFFISPEDRAYAIQQYNLFPERCFVITYGVELNRFSLEQKRAAKERLCAELGLSPDTKLILFNGTLNYRPNLDAVDSILNRINPLFAKSCPGAYKIIICGKGLPDAYEDLKYFEDKDILYAGFVADIQLYFSAADLFLNPITQGGGIKTKLVEALGSSTSGVSFDKGAYGIPQEITGGKLAVVKDGAIAEFVDAMIALLNAPETVTPQIFYDYFNWKNIASRAVAAVKEIAAV